MADHETLFDPKLYIDLNIVDPNKVVETEHSKYIARLLGHEINKILNVVEYYIVCPNPDVESYYDTIEERDANTEDEYDYLFTEWSKTPYDRSEPLIGFLRGLPLLHTDNGIKPSMHLHALYDDIGASSQLILLDDIQEIYKQDDEYALLTANLHDLAAGGFQNGNSNRYEVPVYYDKKTKVWRNRAANTGDLERIIEELAFVPTQILGGSWFEPVSSRPKKWKAPHAS